MSRQEELEAHTPGAGNNAAVSHAAGAELVATTLPHYYCVLSATCLGLQAAAYAEMARQQSSFLHALQTAFTAWPWPLTARTPETPLVERRVTAKVIPFPDRRIPRA